MFVRWESLMDILTRHSVVNNFIETFKTTVNDEKITLCMQNDLIRVCLEQWLDSAEFNDSLKCSVKSRKTRLEANEEFKKDRLKFCCKLYTKAAQFAPHKSLESALAFSNRSAIYMRQNKFQECLNDINVSLDVLENCYINEKELNKDQLIVKLLKRKIECLMSLKQYKKARNCWNNMLTFSKQVNIVSLDDQFAEKCKILSDNEINNSIEIDNSKDFNKPFQTMSCTEDVIKRILEKNKIILPFKSPKLKLSYTEAKGRHFVASTNIDYGEILIFERPFSFVLLPEYYNLFCYNCCMKLDHYSIPCINCCTILFCGEKCRQESWDLYHHLECKQGTSIFKCIGIAHLALRLTLETLRPDCKNDSVYKLLTHIDDFKPLELFQYSLTATLLLLYLKKKTDYFDKHPLLNENSVGNELLHHMIRLVCNGNAISTHLMSYDDSGPSVVDESQPRIGTAIFPTSSLLNHSCDPNIFSSNILKFVVIKASRNIAKGEEVSNCYGPNFRRMRLIDRQVSLKTQYHFDCKCCVCSNPHENDTFFQIFEGLVCLSCNNKIKATLEDLDVRDTVSCNLCSELFKTSEYQSRLTIAKKNYIEGIKLLENNNILEAVNIILESLKLFSQILNQKNTHITKCKDSLAKCFAIIGDFKNCYKYLSKCFETIEERYGKNSLEVAYELDKISDIMVNNLEIIENRNLIKNALVYVRRSKEIFHATLSAWDIPYCELGIANISFKENVLLRFLDGRS